MILQDNFIHYATDHNIECMSQFTLPQKRISIFYDIMSFQKN